MSLSSSMKALWIRSLEIKPIIRLKHPATLAKLTAQVLRHRIGADNIVLRAVWLKLQPDVAHMFSGAMPNSLRVKYLMME